MKMQKFALAIEEKAKDKCANLSEQP